MIAYFLIQWVVVGAWHNKARFVFQYGVQYDQVIKQKEPHDCDFWKAPIGKKECHFDIEAIKLTILTKTDPNTGRPIDSYDDGKSWAWNDVDSKLAVPSTTVYVSWNRVED